MKKYLVLAYYKLTSIEHPQREVFSHKKFFNKRDVSGRIYFSREGINGQMSGAAEDAEAYMAWLRQDSRFQDIEFKIHVHHENVFPRMTVKERKQLVAIDYPIDQSKKGEYLSPAEWRETLERDNDYFLIDVRNDYEWDVGHFKGAERPDCKTFRDFPRYAEQLKERCDPKKMKVLMCCTGGIRCELYSALLKQEGFEQVYQLQGGIIKYGLEEKGKHWQGKLFVFDDRLTVDIGPESEAVAGRCRQCGEPSDHYYNCSNMDCNELFLCCRDCLEKLAGCCQESCCTAPRLRPYSHQNPHKPFRKWYNYFAEKESGRAKERSGECAEAQEYAAGSPGERQ